MQDKYNIYHENKVSSTPGYHHYVQVCMMYSHDLHVPKCMSCHKVIVVIRHIFTNLLCIHIYLSEPYLGLESNFRFFFFFFSQFPILGIFKNIWE